MHTGGVEQVIRLRQDVLRRRSDELSGAARESYEWIRSTERQFTDTHMNTGKGSYGRAARSETRFHPRPLHRYLNELTEYGLLQVTRGNKNTTGYSYKLLERQNIATLQKSITSQLDNVIETVWQAHKTAKATKKVKKPSKSTKAQEKIQEKD